MTSVAVLSRFVRLSRSVAVGFTPGRGQGWAEGLDGQEGLVGREGRMGGNGRRAGRRKRASGRLAEGSLHTLPAFPAFPACPALLPSCPVYWCFASSPMCRSGETGRRAGLKIPCPQGRVGSIPTSGTTLASGSGTKNSELKTQNFGKLSCLRRCSAVNRPSGRSSTCSRLDRRTHPRFRARAARPVRRSS